MCLRLLLYIRLGISMDLDMAQHMDTEMVEGDPAIPIHHSVKLTAVLQIGPSMYLPPPIYLTPQVAEEDRNHIGHVSEATLAAPRVDLHAALHLPLEPTAVRLGPGVEATYTTHARRDILIPGLRLAVTAPTIFVPRTKSQAEDMAILHLCPLHPIQVSNFRKQRHILMKMEPESQNATHGHP